MEYLIINFIVIGLELNFEFLKSRQFINVDVAIYIVYVMYTGI